MSQEHERLQEQPSMHWMSRKVLEQGFPMLEVVGDQPSRLDLARREGGRSASRIQGSRGVASPRVRAYEPHTPDFRPSWSLYSKEGRRHLQLVMTAREVSDIM